MEQKTYLKLAKDLDTLSEEATQYLHKSQEQFKSLSPLIEKQTDPWLKKLNDASLKELSEINVLLKQSEHIQAFLKLKKEMIRTWEKFLTQKKRFGTRILKSRITKNTKQKASQPQDLDALEQKLKEVAETLAAIRNFYAKDIQNFYDQQIGKLCHRLAHLKEKQKVEKQVNSAEKSTLALTKKLTALQQSPLINSSESLNQLYLPLQQLCLVSSKVLKKINSNQSAANEKQDDEQAEAVLPPMPPQMSSNEEWDDEKEEAVLPPKSQKSKIKF